MNKNGTRNVAAVVLVGLLTVACVAVLGNAQSALRLTPGVCNAGGEAKATCTVPSSEGACEVAKLTETEDFPAPAWKPLEAVAIEEGKLEITVTGEYSPRKYGSYNGEPVFRGSIFFCP
jgi:hypothetical protein